MSRAVLLSFVRLLFSITTRASRRLFMRIQATSLAALVVLNCSISAQAGPIVTYDFTATVAGTLDYPGNFNLNGTVPAGAGATGSFTFDAGAPGDSFGPTLTVYDETSMLLSLNIGGGLFIWNSGPFNFFLPRVFVYDNDPRYGDEVVFVGGEAPPTGLTLPAGATTANPFGILVELDLEDPTDTAFSSRNIPTSLDLSDFSARHLYLSGGFAEPGLLRPSGFIGLTLDSLTLPPEPSSVPEPASIFGFGLGGAAIIVGLRRKRRRTFSLDSAYRQQNPGD